MRLFSICLSLVLAVQLLASPPLTITKSGYFLTLVDSNGVPTFEKIANVTDLRGGVVPDVPPVDPPVIQPAPKIDQAIVNSVKASSLAVNDALTAQGIAAVYAHVLGALEDDLITTVNVWPILKTATDSAVGVVASGKDWKPFRDDLSSSITAGRQRGTLSAKADVLRLMRSVQHGLELSADGSTALSLAKMVSIAAKTNEAIDAND